MSPGTVIVGAGQAGAQLAISLRESGYGESITLVGDEQHPPYHRPPLSKDFLAGLSPEADLPIRSPGFYSERGIELLTGTAATSVSRTRREVVLASGQVLAYRHLVLATGARNRRLGFDGPDPDNLHYLRSRDDASRLRKALGQARDVLIAGAGFIGLEFASVAARHGATVTVAEAAGRAMGRAVAPETSAYFTARHRAAGSRVVCDTSIEEFRRDASGRIRQARLGSEICDADLVLAGIGITPNTALAADAGLDVDDGIVVDSRLATRDSAIFAIGDCARYPRPGFSRLVRLESVQNAADQARFLARRLSGQSGEDDSYHAVPWFWSHQGEDKLQIAGLAQPSDDSIPLGDPSSRRFSVARVRNGVLTAVESVNNPRDHLASRRLLGNGTQVSEDELRAPGFSLQPAVSKARAQRG